MRVLDSHHHDGDLVLALGVNRQADEPGPASSFDEDEYQARIKLMEQAGVDCAILMPVNRYIRANGIADTRRMNDAIARYRDRDPVRFPAALGIAEPLHGSASLGEIRRMRAELRLIGVSYHARWQGVATNDPWILRQIELLQELRMLPFVHAHAESNLESPSMVGQIARAFPSVPILVTDALSTRTNTLHFLDVAGRYENIYLETSLLYSPAALRYLVSELGPDRIVFGSDTYSRRMLTRNTPEVIGSLGFSDAELEKILCGNMMRLMGWAGNR